MNEHIKDKLRGLATELHAANAKELLKTSSIVKDRVHARNALAEKLIALAEGRYATRLHYYGE